MPTNTLKAGFSAFLLPDRREYQTLTRVLDANLSGDPQFEIRRFTEQPGNEGNTNPSRHEPSLCLLRRGSLRIPPQMPHQVLDVNLGEFLDALETYSPDLMQISTLGFARAVVVNSRRK